MFLFNMLCLDNCYDNLLDELNLMLGIIMRYQNYDKNNHLLPQASKVMIHRDGIRLNDAHLKKTVGSCAADNICVQTTRK